jgi:REP element-mobilizing transposase RayT
MAFYKGRYRIASTRLAGWDYRSAGYYFVTICTARRARHFGSIAGGVIHLSDIGRAAHDEWLKSAALRSNVSLDAFVIMPDHLHGIVILHSDDPAATYTARNRFGPLPSGSLQSLINGYKGAVTRWARLHGRSDFAWQPRYWETIIRGPAHLRAVRRYIGNNPLRWAQG